MEIEREGVDWIYLFQDRGMCQALVNTVMNFWVPLDTWNFLTN
jgi:hypothetical protein